MKLSRPSRFIAAFIALFGMLFMQLAVASYVCPGMKTGGGSDTVAMSATGVDQQGMSRCEGMDMTQIGLCHAHAYDQAGKQSLDKPELPLVQPFVPVGLVLALDAIDVTARPLAMPPESSLLTRTTAPPISIRNCCFRI